MVSAFPSRRGQFGWGRKTPSGDSPLDPTLSSENSDTCTVDEQDARLPYTERTEGKCSNVKEQDRSADASAHPVHWG